MKSHNSILFRAKLPAAFAAAALMVTGCFVSEGRVSGPPSGEESRDVVMNIRMGVGGVNALGKTAVISLDKMIVVMSSSANDTIRDTITSSTTPALNPVSTTGQTVAKNYELAALRSWKVSVTVRDVLDSIIHHDSATIPALYAGDTAIVLLGLDARYSMYEAKFLSLPDSIQSATPSQPKQKLDINRLVLKINDVVVRDSTADPGPYYTPLATHSLGYDYVSLGNGSWVSVPSGTSQDLYGIGFGSPDTGFIFGDNMTLKTVDGGAAWEEKGHAPLIIRGGHVINGSTAYAAGDFGIVSFTHDGGDSGAAYFIPEPDFPEATDNPSLNSVFFPTASMGLVAGNEGSIWKTTDSSVTWTAQTSGTSEDLNSIYFLDVNTGWVAGNAGTILKTTNGGASWSSQVSGTGNDLNGIHFVDANVGWAVGGNGTILKTTNGGTSWSSQIGGTAESLNSLYFLNSSTGYAVGDNGTVLRTQNGGTAWESQTSGTTQKLRSVQFFGSKGYAVGDAGTVLSLIPGNILVELLAYGPMGYWDEADPLYRGSKVISTVAGQDSTVSLNLDWVGPTTGTGSLEVELGRVGKVTIEGTMPGTVAP